MTPYLEIRKYYNSLFLNLTDKFVEEINRSKSPFEQAVKYAIVGNIVDFNPIHGAKIEDVMKYFDNADSQTLAVNQTEKLSRDIQNCKTLLYIGDNCGEICLDKILIQKIKELNPEIEIYFGVRGEPVVNDSVEADAYQVGMDSCAKIINNGDCSLGTVLDRTSGEFRNVFDQSDIIIAKGQANYESLNEEKDKNIYFLLMSKCEVIASDIGVPQKSLICLNYIQSKQMSARKV